METGLKVPPGNSDAANSDTCFRKLILAQTWCAINVYQMNILHIIDSHLWYKTLEIILKKETALIMSQAGTDVPWRLIKEYEI